MRWNSGVRGREGEKEGGREGKEEEGGNRLQWKGLVYPRQTGAGGTRPEDLKRRSLAYSSEFPGSQRIGRHTHKKYKSNLILLATYTSTYLLCPGRSFSSY